MIKSLYPCFQHWSEKGAVYLVSDTHFKDPDRRHMGYYITDEDQFYFLADTCHKNDTLIHLGDVGDLSYIKRLKCYKVLIMGNHDQGITNFQRKETEIDLDDCTLEEAEQMVDKGEVDRITLNFYKPFTKGYKSNNLFDEVYTGPLWISKKIVLSHEPLWVEGVETYQQSPIAFNIHGHDHNRKNKETYYSLNLAQNVYGYTPLNLNQFIKSGKLKNINDIHRTTIDNATVNKKYFPNINTWGADITKKERGNEFEF